MSYAEYRAALRADLYRYGGVSGLRAGVSRLLDTPGFAFTFWLRTCAYTRFHRTWRWLVYPFAALAFHRCTYRYGISIPFHTRIGSGLYIGHFGGIVVHPEAVIGRNCNLSQGVTLGVVNRGKHQGVPTLGDRVYVGPGAKIIGGIRVGDGAAVGANAVVTADVPERGVAVGVPARVISSDGAEGYVEFTL